MLAFSSTFMFGDFDLARSKEVLLGHLRGVGADGGPASVSVYKAGRDYRISHLDNAHLCHPSVRSIAKVKAEAFLVFHVGKTSFEPL
jgi:hypothetical protein